MHELPRMNSAHAMRLEASAGLFRPRGGAAGRNADGWGLAFPEGRGARICKAPAPARDSRCLGLLSACGLRNATVIARIRRAIPSRTGSSHAAKHPCRNAHPPPRRKRGPHPAQEPAHELVRDDVRPFGPFRRGAQGRLRDGARVLRTCRGAPAGREISGRAKALMALATGIPEPGEGCFASRAKAAPTPWAIRRA